MTDLSTDGIVLEARADLDLPGETARQTKIFATWVLCLFLALVLSSIAASRAGEGGSSMFRTDAELAAKRAARVRVGLPVGLLLPALLTWVIHHRHRRGGGHARGIFVDVTRGGELRIWGRGYGSRVALEGAEVVERLVDVYAGRLGAWRQRRLKVRAKAQGRGSASELEIATVAVRADMDLGLRLEGGEGDCVELTRDDFLRVREAVLSAIGQAAAPPPAPSEAPPPAPAEAPPPAPSEALPPPSEAPPPAPAEAPAEAAPEAATAPPVTGTSRP